MKSQPPEKSTDHEEESVDSDPGPASESGDVAMTFCSTLVDEWVHLGLTDAVVSPGSRSAPMALALIDENRIKVHVHHDERCAAFMALGLALRTRRPVAVLCTSGTAAAEFHPAVIEAHQANVPLLVLTADRPPELQGVGAPQTIDQRRLYGAAVRWYRDAGVPVDETRGDWRGLATRAWRHAAGERSGPVHLNLPFREPLGGICGELPPREVGAGDDASARTVEPIGGGGLTPTDVALLADEFSGKRGVIVAGVRSAQVDADTRSLHLLADELGWPVFADAASGCRIEVLGCVTAFDGILRDRRFADVNQPEVVVQVGGLLTSKALDRWVSESAAFKVGFDPYGSVPDPHRAFDRRYAVGTATAFDQIRAATIKPAPDAWRDRWIRAERVAVDAVDSLLSRYSQATEPAVAIDLFTLLSDDGTVVLSSSMPVRDAEWFAPPRKGVRTLSNRGANGIDGVISTAVGAALSGSPTALLIGDVAFLHDSNALIGLMSRNVNMVIVVVNNNGGGIFSFLPIRDEIDGARFERIFGTPHGVDLAVLASAHRLPAEKVSTRTGLQAAVAGALTRGGPRMVIVETVRAENVVVHDQIESAIAKALEGLES